MSHIAKIFQKIVLGRETKLEISEEQCTFVEDKGASAKIERSIEMQRCVCRFSKKIDMKKVCVNTVKLIV